MSINGSHNGGQSARWEAKMDTKIFSTMMPTAVPTLRATIANTLERFGTDALEYANKRRIQVRPLEVGERYDEASPALARIGVDVDGWPAPPAGLFVVEERTVYIRSQSAMTIAHEFGHALDCALGGGGLPFGPRPEGSGGVRPSA